MKLDGSQKISNSLFHFTSRQVALELILSPRMFKLSPLNKSNDPRENFNLGFGTVNAEFREEAFFENYNMWVEKVNSIRKDARILCFSKDYFVENEYWDGYNLSRMWSQYGDNHSGVCLEIDKDVFMKENSEFFNRPHVKFEEVDYSNDRKFWIDFSNLGELGEQEFLNKIRDTKYRYLFFRKTIDWDDEHEDRVVVFDNNIDNNFLSIGESLKKVIVGIDYPEESMQILHSLVGNKIARIRYENGKMEAWQFGDDYYESLKAK